MKRHLSAIVSALVASAAAITLAAAGAGALGTTGGTTTAHDNWPAVAPINA